MKIREKRRSTGGFGGPVEQERVRVLKEGETLPTGADTVPDDTPEHDWQGPAPLPAPVEEVRTNG